MSDADPIRPYRDEQLDEVADLLALAYHENPIQVVIFGGAGAEALRQRRALFALMLPALLTGTKIVAVQNDRIVGFAHWISHPGCHPSDETLAAVAPPLFAALDEDVMTRVLTWRQAWGARDPDHPHSHFGPFAVHPDAQGRGLGRRMLTHYCAELDRRDEPGYLETERIENVRLYEKSGFAVLSTLDVLGVQSWFMMRPKT